MSEFGIKFWIDLYNNFKFDATENSKAFSKWMVNNMTINNFVSYFINFNKKREISDNTVIIQHYILKFTTYLVFTSVGQLFFPLYMYISLSVGEIRSPDAS